MATELNGLLKTPQQFRGILNKAKLISICAMGLAITACGKLNSLKREVRPGMTENDARSVINSFCKREKGFEANYGLGIIIVNETDTYSLRQLVIKFVNGKVSEVLIKDSGTQ